MKTLLPILLTVVVLSSCDPNADKQVGRTNPLGNANPAGGNGAGGGNGSASTSTNGTTDVPIDGGLGILLLSGVAYGVKRVRGAKQKSQ